MRRTLRSSPDSRWHAMIGLRWIGITLIGLFGGWTVSSMHMFTTASVDLSDTAAALPSQGDIRYQGWRLRLPAWEMPASRLIMPVDVALDARGHLHVADVRRNAIFEFDLEGEILSIDRQAPFDTRRRVNNRLVPVSIGMSHSSRRRVTIWIDPAGDVPLHNLERARCSKLSLSRVDVLEDDGWRLGQLRGAPGSKGLYHDAVFYDSDSFIVLGYGTGVGCPATPFHPVLSALSIDKIVIPRYVVLLKEQEERWVLTLGVEPMYVQGEELAIAGMQTIAPASGGMADGLDVLVRPTDGDPMADHIRRFDGQLEPMGGIAVAGVPHPPDIEWPWNLSRDVEGGFAFTTASEVFEIHRLNPDGSPRFRIAGAPAGGPFQAHNEELPEWVLGAPRAVAALADGGAVVADDSAYQLVHFYDAEGQAIADEAGRRYLDVASDGRAIFALSRGEIRRQQRVAVGAAPVWRQPCDCGEDARIAADADRLWLALPDQGEIRELDPRTGATLRTLRRAGEGYWPLDIAAIPGGVASLDREGHRLEIWRAGESPERSFPVGLGSRGWRIAGMGGDAAELALLTADGTIERYQLGDGERLDAWRPALGGGEPFHPRDLAFDLGGAQLFLVDPARTALQVFDRSDLPPSATPTATRPSRRPTWTPTPWASPTTVPADCLVVGDKLAAPSRLAVGQSLTVTLSIRADCPDRRAWDGADLVIVLDRSASMRGWKREVAYQILADTLGELAGLGNRATLLAFGDAVEAVEPFTEDVASVAAAAERLPAAGETNLGAALMALPSLLESRDRPGAMPIVVLLSDGNATDAVSVETALAPTRAGAEVLVVAIGEDANLDALRRWFGDAAVLSADRSGASAVRLREEILYRIYGTVARDWRIEDGIASEFAIEAASVRPAAVRGAGRLFWQRPILPREGLSLTYRLRALQVGRFATNRFAHADYLDADLQPRRFVFPIPQVEVYLPSPTPTSPPSETPTAAPEPSSTATVAPRSGLAYLPLLLHEPACDASTRPMDVVLAIDASTSMAGDKLEAAQAAALRFALTLRPGRDRVALLAFGGEARLLSGLSSDIGRIRSALDAIETLPGTRIDRGLGTALEALAGDGRPEAKLAILLLTDGRQEDEAERSIVVADEARQRGVEIHVVGLGADIDVAYLVRVAGDTSNFHPAASSAELLRIYALLAQRIPCP